MRTCIQLLKCLLFFSIVFSGSVSAKVLPQQLAVIVNTNDSNSRLIAEYYRTKRGIAEENIIEISIAGSGNAINEKHFSRLYNEVKRKTPSSVQYYALAWSKPYKAGCMSITTAFAFGFDKAFCAKGCNPTRQSAYFNSTSVVPYDDLKIRPTMMLAGSSLQQVYKMIDRGVRSDGMRPKASAYLLNTTDKNRNVRSRSYDNVQKHLSYKINIEQIKNNALEDKNDVMFYFTGLKHVKKIKSNTFVPGAIADHLTSAGGNLFSKSQMSILRWLDAGATGSYGAVIEPCNFTQKFPHPGLVIDGYTRGASLIEAYWKSVAWPGQGIFIGEPMAAPYAIRKL